MIKDEFDFVGTDTEALDFIRPWLDKGVKLEKFISDGPGGGNPNAHLAFDSAETLKAFVTAYYDGDKEMIADHLQAL